MSELDKKSYEQSAEALEALKQEAERGEERLNEKFENLEKRSPERSLDKNEIKKEALEHAHNHEKELKQKEMERSQESRERQKITPIAERDQAYANIMKDTRKEMSPAGRVFSKIIHNKAVEATSEVVGKTIARPNAILSGSIFAFVFALAVFLIAKRYGYPLSGTESILSFAAGWLVGILFDFFKTMVTGKHS